MLYFGHSLIDAGGNSVVQISAIDDIGKIPGFLTLKGGYLLGIARYFVWCLTPSELGNRAK